MSEVIYRKYRPKTFKEVVGQKPIKITLENEITSGNVAHAYLFVGPRGTGKTTLARLFARSLNCLNRQDGSPEACNECDICKLILSGRSMDIIEIDAASHTGVDNVRDNIIANSQIPPFNNKGYKVFIIDEIHMLSKSAFNALLKTLEEPPKHVIFILATTEIHKVPETIISRCQRFDFKKIPLKDIVKRMTGIIEWEKVIVPENILAQIARRSEGCLRDAESLLGQVISLGGKEVTEELASLILPNSNWQEVDILVEALQVHNLSTALNQINKLVVEGIDLHEFASDFIEYLRQIMLYQIIGPKFTLDFDDNSIVAIKKHAKEFPLADLSNLLNIVLDKMTIKETLIDQLPLELACVEFLLEKPQINLEIKKQITDAPAISNQEETIKVSTSSHDIKNLQVIWPKLVTQTKALNHSISNILRTSHPLTIDQKSISIGLEYNFDREQLDKIDIKNNLVNIFTKLLGYKVEIQFIVDENYKENHQNFKGKNENGVNEALDTFGGEML